jgi:hypothetical protein
VLPACAIPLMVLAQYPERPITILAACGPGAVAACPGLAEATPRQLRVPHGEPVGRPPTSRFHPRIVDTI